MRIVIDMQGAQTESRYRGIGRFTMSFAQAIARNRGSHEVFLALSGFFPDTIRPIREAFAGLVPAENIRVWYAPGPVLQMSSANAVRVKMAELIREAFIAELQPDIVHLCSLFEGYLDDAVTSIRRFDSRVRVSVTLHDLIPLLNAAQYLDTNPSYKDYYLRKVEYLKQADLILAISKFSMQEGIDCLGIAADRIGYASNAVDGDFRPAVVPEAERKALFARLGIERPFVLYSGGADERKNLPRLLQAFAALPEHLKRDFQLVLAGRISEGDAGLLRRAAASSGLRDSEWRMVGYVTDKELIQLYQSCALFAFPSWHEGFGLPALEAMACGAPVIAAGTSSLPEVVGNPDALFDPFDVSSIARKLEEALADEAFRASLRERGLQRVPMFSWEETARTAVQAFEQLIDADEAGAAAQKPTGAKPRLAFVSPLAPQRTGIAGYSGDLLPQLAEHYDIELIVEQPSVTDPWARDHGRVRDVAWFVAHASEMDRVIYQMGNSPYHWYMLPLMKEIPGVVVLHDFFLSSLLAWAETVLGSTVWSGSLRSSHGYYALAQRYRDAEEAKRRYPTNFEVLQYAKGVIVHSEHSRELGERWYGDGVTRDWRVIPLVRKPAAQHDRLEAKAALGLAPDTFVTCSFGFIDPTKLNHRILDAWLGSQLAKDGRCILVFVGDNHSGDYGARLTATIAASGLQDRIRITGFASDEMFEQYLSVADLAVQLRTQSRGETSAAVLDCMNYGIPLICNAHGSAAEVDAAAICMLRDDFEDAELIESIEALAGDADRRAGLGHLASTIIRERHSPSACAAQYRDALEGFYAKSAPCLPALVGSIADLAPEELARVDVATLAEQMAKTFPLASSSRRLIMDVTATRRTSLNTGIERVVRKISGHWLASLPEGLRADPVFLSSDEEGRFSYRCANQWAIDLLGGGESSLADEKMDFRAGDVLIVFDVSGDPLVRAAKQGLYRDLSNQGVEIWVLTYDLLPILYPAFFPPGASEAFTEWFAAAAEHASGVACISAWCAQTVRQWLDAEFGARARNVRVAHFPLGSDFAHSVATTELSGDEEEFLAGMDGKVTFLSVATIEPRKGHHQLIGAFEQLWASGVDVRLVLVGKEGWRDLPPHARRTIPAIVERLQTHSELNKRLFWLNSVSDAFLTRIYGQASCFVYASEGEGFGLPLIEAAHHGLPVLSRDLDVFREVLGDRATYFSGDASALAEAVRKWLALDAKDALPSQRDVIWPTWAESAEQLARIVGTSSVQGS
ncbi:glycosyltransferase [Uliginosibacterium sp. sgz301328]|uniref:glycosyltransferase n=1 Tax=Uliginosibacterium sp. sgz301328 TaxID=3243764 RepID=UPI00359D9D29